MGNAGSRMSITPEQFVQQRAAMSPPTPLYAHQCQPPSNTLRANTPTPPLANRSNDYMAHHSRNSPTDLLQRPSSRGANVALGPSGTGDIPTALSAREQEHIAKMTGSPLISMAHNNNRQGPPSGLVGAIEAREREKQQAKQDINRLSISNSSSITRSRWQRIIGHLSSIIWVNIHSNTRKLRDSNNNKVGEIRLQQASLHKVADGAHLPLHQAMQVLSRVDNRPRNTRLVNSSTSHHSHHSKGGAMGLFMDTAIRY